MEEDVYQEEGLALFQKLLKEAPKETMIWNSWAAYLWNEKQDYKAAEEAYLSGLKANRRDPYLLGNLGELYIDVLKEYDKGVELYRQSIASEDQPYRLTVMVTALVENYEDKWEEAYKYYQILVQKYNPRTVKRHRDLKDEQWEAFLKAEKALKLHFDLDVI